MTSVLLTLQRMNRVRAIDAAASGDRAQALLDGKPKHLFRPPYGHMSLSLLAFCVRRNGAPLAYWSRDSMDYTWSADRVVDGFDRKPPRPGDILLFHDDGDVAASALEKLIPVWKRQGLLFAALGQADKTAP